MGEAGDDDDPGPGVGGFRVADLGNTPAEGLFEESEGVFDVEAAQPHHPDPISALDGLANTSLTLAIDEPYCQLTVAGGPTMLVVSGELADESIIDLLTSDADPDTAAVELVCGGNCATFDASHVVSVGQAIEAVDDFLADFPNGLGTEWDVG